MICLHWGSLGKIPGIMTSSATTAILEIMTLCHLMPPCLGESRGRERGALRQLGRSVGQSVGHVVIGTYLIRPVAKQEATVSFQEFETPIAHRLDRLRIAD